MIKVHAFWLRDVEVYFRRGNGPWSTYMHIGNARRGRSKRWLLAAQKESGIWIDTSIRGLWCQARHNYRTWWLGFAIERWATSLVHPPFQKRGFGFKMIRSIVSKMDHHVHEWRRKVGWGSIKGSGRTRLLSNSSKIFLIQRMITTKATLN